MQSNVALQVERVLKEQGNVILRCAYSYLHNMSDAEEILQDVLIQYMKTNPVFQNPQHEKAWLLTVAANLSKNRIKYHRLRETDELKEELAAEGGSVFCVGGSKKSAADPEGSDPSLLSGRIFHKRDCRDSAAERSNHSDRSAACEIEIKGNFEGGVRF